MDSKLAIDMKNLSETERQVIFNVLKRDEELRKRDEQRIMRLKSELQWLRRRGAIRGGLDPMTSCARCRCQLGKIINRGAPCTVCRAKVCKSCRVYAHDGIHWFCVVCHKQLEIEAATGEWMNEFVRRASRRRDRKAFVPPADVVRETISRGETVGNNGKKQEKERIVGAAGGTVPHFVIAQQSRAAPSSMEQRPVQGATSAASENQQSTVFVFETASPIRSPKSPREKSPSSPRQSSSPVPSPRQKSPLLKQRAVVVDQEIGDNELASNGRVTTVPAPPLTLPRKRAPGPPRHHPSDRSDSGIGQEQLQRSPKASHSDSIHSRQSSSCSSSGCTDSRGAFSFKTESQTTTTDSVSDLSDSEVEPSTGVVFRKVSLKRRKHKTGRKYQSDEQSICGASQPPTRASGPSRPPSTSILTPHFPSKYNPLLERHLTFTNSNNDPCWWPETVDSARIVYLCSELTLKDRKTTKGVGLRSGLSRSLETVSASEADIETKEEDDTPTSQVLSSSWTPETTLFFGSAGVPRVTGDLVGNVICRGGICDDLRLSSPDYEEDYLLDCCGTNSAPAIIGSDSCSDLLCNVTDKIVPEGEEYRIVFISSSSSKSSALNSTDDSTSSSPRISVLLMDDSEWDSTGSSNSPPPLPLAPPPTLPPGIIEDGYSPPCNLEEVEWKDDLENDWMELRAEAHSPAKGERDEMAFPKSPSPLSDCLPFSMVATTPSLKDSDEEVCGWNLNVESSDDEAMMNLVFVGEDGVSSIISVVEDDPNVGVEKGPAAEEVDLKSNIESVLSATEWTVQLSEIANDESGVENNLDDFAVEKSGNGLEKCLDVAKQTSSDTCDETPDEVGVCDSETSLANCANDAVVDSVNQLTTANDDECFSLVLDDEVEKSDAESQDTIIEGESYHRLKQVAIREKLLEANKELVNEGEQIATVVDGGESAGQVEESGDADADACRPIMQPVADLHQLIAQSRALTADGQGDSGAGSEGLTSSGRSVLENYFVTALEHTAPGFGRTLRHPMLKMVDVPAITVVDVDGDVLVMSDTDDTCSEGPSESEHYDDSTNGEDSETTAYDGNDSDSDSTVSSTSSEEGTIYLRMTPVAIEEQNTRRSLDMSLHTILEESCEESESERSLDYSRRRNPSSTRISDPSELERYYQYTFGGSVSNVLLDEEVVAAAVPVPQPPVIPLMFPSRSEDSEFSDDTMSETGSSCFSESTDVGESLDDDELARLASSRLEKYFLTGFLGMDGAFGALTSDEATNASVVGCGSCIAQDGKEDEDVESPFDKNDGCDTIKRKKKQQEPKPKTVVVGAEEVEEKVAKTAVIAIETKDEDIDALPTSVVSPKEEEDSDDVTEGAVSSSSTDQGLGSSTEDEVSLSSALISESQLQVEVSRSSATVGEPETCSKEESVTVTEVLGDPSLENISVEVVSCEEPEVDRCDDPVIDSSYIGASIGRSLTSDWKQQSRDSGFIGSSDDLLREGAERELDYAEHADDDVSFEKLTLDDMAQISSTTDAKDAAPLPLAPTLPTVSSSSSLFGQFRNSSRSLRSSYGGASTTSDDEAQYIVNQLVTQIAKSMTKSPQLARAKPPEIEVFESELTKLMQCVPGIDATVKEIVEELSSTDYCSDSYESSDYTSSDQEALPFTFEVHKMPPFPVGFGGQFRRNDSGRSWRSSTSTASKSSSLGQKEGGDESGQQLSEETMFTYQRFMDSLTKMAEHVSDDASSIGGDSIGSKSGSRSPPTFAKIVSHIKDKLTTLMREVQAENRSPKMTGADADLNHRRTIVWRKPSSGCGSAAGDELSISSTTSSTTFDSEDSPTDTELSMDSDDPTSVVLLAYSGNTTVALQALNQAKAQIEADTVAATSGRARALSSTVGRAALNDDAGLAADGLERWSSDMTIVDDDVRYTSVHKSEPMLSTPDDLAENKRHSLSFDTRLTSRIGGSGFPSNTLQQRHHSAGKQVGSAGSLYSLSKEPKRKCRSEWEMWRASSDSADDVNSSSLTISSATVTLSNSAGTPEKHNSCDPLPCVPTPKAEPITATNLISPATATTVPRDRRKHGLAFMWRQKSGSSTSLRDVSATPDSQSIKQQVQFRSSLQLQSAKKKDDHRHWLFGGHKQRDCNTKTSQYTNSVKSCVSSPESLSDVGVDVTNAPGVNLSDGESENGRVTLHPTAATGRHHHHHHSVRPHPLGHSTAPCPSSHSLSFNPSPWAKASTLPRAAGPDLFFAPNVSFLHKSNRCLTANTLPHSYTLVPEQDGNGRKATATNVATSCNPSKQTVVATKSLESPKFRREVRSWPDENSPGLRPSSQNAVSTDPQNGERVKSIVAATSAETKFVPNISVVEYFDKGVQRTGGGSGSHTGSSDHESMTEEDIDRLVALHKNRSLSSLGVCSESMSSVYSAAGGGHYGTVSVRGDVQFGLSYNYVSGALEVHIKQCRDLAPVDVKRSRSDPYVKVYLLPDKSKSGKRKTRVKKHTLNPSFNEVLKFNVTISELETRTLWLTVWHSDMFGRNEFLGEVTLPMGYEAFDDTSPKWYLLQERLGPPEEVFSYKGDLVVALRFVPPDVTNQKRGQRCKGSLHVLVKEARNLMAVAANGTSDPFCKCYLLPDKGKSNKQKTPVIKRSCHPKWNHTFVYDDVSLESLRERCLELTVWDYDRLTSNDFLGGVRLSLGSGKYQAKKVDWMDSRGEEVAIWQTVLDRPNVWVDSTILLRPTMDHRQTTL